MYISTYPPQAPRRTVPHQGLSTAPKTSLWEAEGKSKGAKGPPPAPGKGSGKGGLAKAASSSSDKPRKPDVKPVVPTKKLFWSSFRGNTEDTIWGAMEDDARDAVDYAVLEQLFAIAGEGAAKAVQDFSPKLI